STDDVDGAENLAQRREDFVLARFGQTALGIGECRRGLLRHILERLVVGERRCARIRPPPGNRGAQLAADGLWIDRWRLSDEELGYDQRRLTARIRAGDNSDAGMRNRRIHVVGAVG